MNREIIISDKKRIISLRHILVHDYDLIEDETIWGSLQKPAPNSEDRNSNNFKHKIINPDFRLITYELRLTTNNGHSKYKKQVWYHR